MKGGSAAAAATPGDTIPMDKARRAAATKASAFLMVGANFLRVIAHLSQGLLWILCAPRLAAETPDCLSSRGRTA
ncbi:hypothetical protein GCM10023194_64000 [Planotetraspora phitsanulokensis]